MEGASLVETLAGLVRNLPGVDSGGRPGHVSLTVGGKVFAFTQGEGVALKLPAERIAALREAGKAEYLVMGKRRMKE